MPGGDMTGPLGLGLGNWGYGRGWCRRWKYEQLRPLTLNKEEQKKVLEAEKEELKADLKRIEEKLKEL